MTVSNRAGEPSTDGPGPRRRGLFGEPLVQFGIPAALLFALNAWTSDGAADAEAREIRVTAAIASALEEERALVLGRPLTERERGELLDRYIAQEVLVREARAMGLDRDDGRVREILVDKMMFLLDEVPPEPSDAQLEAYYSAHIELYSTRPGVTMDQVFFESPGDDLDGDDILARLRGGEAPDAMGDRFFSAGAMGRVALAELSVAFGDGFSEAVGGLEPGGWQGPLLSDRGVHFVRIQARHEPVVRPREAVEYHLRSDWVNTWLAEVRDGRVAELLAGYTVVVETEEGG